MESWKPPKISFSTRMVKSRKTGGMMAYVNVTGEFTTPPLLCVWNPCLHGNGRHYLDNLDEPAKYNVSVRNPSAFPEWLLSMCPNITDDTARSIEFAQDVFERGMRHLFEDNRVLKAQKKDLLPEAKRIAAQIAKVDAKRMANDDPRVIEEQWRSFLSGCTNPIGTHSVDGVDVPMLRCSRKLEQFVYPKGKVNIPIEVRDRNNGILDVTETPAIFQGNLVALSIRISIFVNDSGARGMRFEPMSVQRVADSSEVPLSSMSHVSSFVSYPPLEMEEVITCKKRTSSPEEMSQPRQKKRSKA